MTMRLLHATAAAFALLSAVSVAEDAPHHCSLDDLSALQHSLDGSHVQKLCEADVGESLDDLISGNISQPQANAFSNSSACKSLYETVVANVANATSTCVELRNYLPKVTWAMVTSVVDVVAYPRASTDCDLDALQSKGMTLSTSSNLLPCLAATGLASSFMTHSSPVSAQWTLAGQTPACHALFSQAKAVVLAFPACNIQGVNIHAVDQVEFDQVVPWLVLASDIQHEPRSLLHSSVRALWTAATRRHGGDVAGVDATWAVGVGSLAALAALVAKFHRGRKSKWARGRPHEQTSLLQYAPI